MDADEFRRAAHAAVEEIISYNASLSSRSPLPKIQPGYLASLLPSTAPVNPEPWDQIQADIERTIQPGLTHWQSPNFMAFFPASVTYPSLLGEMYSAAFTAPAFNWIASPACTELEVVVLDWLARILGLPAEFLSTSSNGGGGVIQGSASEAVITVMVAARERWLNDVADGEGLPEGSREREDRKAALRPKLVALGSDQAHSCTMKGAAICGVRYRDIKARLEDGLAMTGERLKAVLDECEKEGLIPFYLTTTFGTTSTCAVDRFEEVKATLKVWQEEKTERGRVWVHVDAAYAGAALICEEFQSHARDWDKGIDSFDINMHKWLLVNFDASCLFIRSRTDLTRTLSANPYYLQNQYSASGLVTDYRDWQLPLGRRFRALKIWFVLRSYGVTGLQAHIRNTLTIGDVFSTLVRGRGDLFEIVTEPAFGLTVFRIKPLGYSQTSQDHFVKAEDDALVKAANELTKEVYETVNARGQIFITSSVVCGVYCIRLVSANALAEEKYVRNAFKILVGITEEVLAKK